jgi:hypothetical protein
MRFTKVPSQAISANCLVVGSGKTVLCSSIIAQLRQETTSAAGDRPCGSLAYFYCSFQDESTKEVRTLLKSLIRQLCPMGVLPSSLQKMYKRCQNTYPQDEPSVANLRETLGDMIMELNTRDTAASDSWHVYLVIDALDEVPRGAHRDTFLDLLTHVASLQFTRLHMLVTARDDDGHIQGRLDTWKPVLMDNAKISMDIEKLVTSTVSKKGSELQDLSPSTHEAIKNRLASAGSGM